MPMRPTLAADGLETGARHTQFWRAAVEKEVAQRAAHKPWLIASVVDEFQNDAGQPRFGKEADHGLVYCTLHDLHRQKSGMARSSSEVKLPPVRKQTPIPVGGLWRWPGGPPLPADVQSAITATTVSIPPSVLSALSQTSQTSRASRSALAPFLQAQQWGPASQVQASTP
ncbi:unnamed protein product [Effrenium voratum]|nr:unnamed protein product [Effrenium voratum]